MNDRISVVYAPLVALYQLLDARLGEPGGRLEGRGWADHLKAPAQAVTVTGGAGA
jgi:hypothetical protein